jgi:hypothetical protein
MSTKGYIWSMIISVCAWITSLILSLDVYNNTGTLEGDANATWMANGMQWPGTWIDPTENHRKGHHVGIVKVLKVQSRFMYI